MTHQSAPHTCVFGLGWGDEGKGKVVDLLCPAFDFVVRFNGGANAGHTVCVGSDTFAVHVLPTGVLHDSVTAVIGPGVVADPVALCDELNALVERGIDASARLRISDRAHLVMPYHILEDRFSEHAASDDGRIGTTARGIGPCYAEKMRRSSAIRFADLIDERRLDERLATIVDAKRRAFIAIYGEDGGLDVEPVRAMLAKARSRLGGHVCDTTELLANAVTERRPILFEGANGMLLDVDHGTYPFVTSSSTGPHGIGAGAGVDPSIVTLRVGTLKAYATRVGSGPFVSELDDEIGERIRQAGKEFGTTTGRPRRCGWFDAVASRRGTRLTGTTDIALMHLDTLSGLQQVGICTGYRIGTTTCPAPPPSVDRLAAAEPVIEYLPGWDADLREVRRFEDLPPAALDYLKRIEDLVGVRVSLVGVGPDRAQTLARGPLRDIIRTPVGSTA